MKGVGFVRRRIDLARLRIHDAARITKTCTIGGVPMLVEVGNPRELSRMGGYRWKEPDTVEWINRYVKPGDVFYDIGANLGLYSILAAKLLQGRGKVYRFEPESQN